MYFPIETRLDVQAHFSGKIWCYVAVVPKDGPDTCNGMLGVAVANEQGYYPLKMTYTEKYDDAADKARDLNRDELELTNEQITRIELSTMGGQRFEPTTADNKRGDVCGCGGLCDSTGPCPMANNHGRPERKPI